MARYKSGRMRETGLLAILLLSLCFAVTACDLTSAKKAEKVYSEEGYSEVIAILDGEQNLSEETAEMLAVSKAHVAFDEGRYLDVLAELAVVDSDKGRSLRDSTVRNLSEKALKSASAKELLSAITRRARAL